MLCQVPHRLCSLSVGQGSWGIPGETHSWEVIEFEGKRQHREKDRIAQTQWISRKRLHHKRAKGDVDVQYKGSVTFSKQNQISSFLFNTLHSLELQGGMSVDKHTSCGYGCFMLQGLKVAF